MFVSEYVFYLGAWVTINVTSVTVRVVDHGQEHYFEIARPRTVLLLLQRCLHEIMPCYCKKKTIIILNQENQCETS